jgi:hypothetical protein
LPRINGTTLKTPAPLGAGSLLLFGFSIPIFFFTGYYSHNTYYKKWHNFYLENCLKKWDENHKE